MLNRDHDKSKPERHATPRCDGGSIRLNPDDADTIDRLCDHVSELYAALIQLTEHVAGSATCSKAGTNEESV